MPSSSHQSLTVLLVDDQSNTRVAVAAELDRAGHRVLEADSAEWALELFKRHQPDLVLLDIEMPGHNGYWAARQMRAAEPGGWTPIIFLSLRDQAEDVWAGIEAGGDDYLVRPVSPMILLAKLRAMQRLQRMRQELLRVSAELQAANGQLQELSRRDALTGLMNRRAPDEHLHEEILKSRDTNTPLTVILCDVDYFKRNNDRLGHLEGDACLANLATMLKQTCRRPGDVSARYGGEEFALVLPQTPRSGAITDARALARTLESAALPHPASGVGSYVTLSGGITTCVPDETTTAQGLLLRADDALYMAKDRARNRFFSYEMQMDTIEQHRSRRVAGAVKDTQA